RNDIIWHKPNAMPESVTDRLASDYEHVFMFAKSRRYWFDLDAVRKSAVEPGARVERSPAESWSNGTGLAPHRGHRGTHELGRNPGSVWDIPTTPFAEAHFAVMAIALADRCVQAGCKTGGTVLDPFSGAGTTGLAAARHGRRYIGID